MEKGAKQRVEQEGLGAKKHSRNAGISNHKPNLDRNNSNQKSVERIEHFSMNKSLLPEDKNAIKKKNNIQLIKFNDQIKLKMKPLKSTPVGMIDNQVNAKNEILAKKIENMTNQSINRSKPKMTDNSKEKLREEIKTGSVAPPKIGGNAIIPSSSSKMINTVQGNTGHDNSRNRIQKLFNNKTSKLSQNFPGSNASHSNIKTAQIENDNLHDLQSILNNTLEKINKISAAKNNFKPISRVIASSSNNRKTPDETYPNSAIGGSPSAAQSNISLLKEFPEIKPIKRKLKIPKQHTGGVVPEPKRGSAIQHHHAEGMNLSHSQHNFFRSNEILVEPSKKEQSTSMNSIDKLKIRRSLTKETHNNAQPGINLSNNYNSSSNSKAFLKTEEKPSSIFDKGQIYFNQEKLSFPLNTQNNQPEMSNNSQNTNLKFVNVNNTNLSINLGNHAFLPHTSGKSKDIKSKNSSLNSLSSDRGYSKVFHIINTNLNEAGKKGILGSPLNILNVLISSLKQASSYYPKFKKINEFIKQHYRRESNKQESEKDEIIFRLMKENEELQSLLNSNIKSGKDNTINSDSIGLAKSSSVSAIKQPQPEKVKGPRELALEKENLSLKRDLRELTSLLTLLENQGKLMEEERQDLINVINDKENEIIFLREKETKLMKILYTLHKNGINLDKIIDSVDKSVDKNVSGTSSKDLAVLLSQISKLDWKPTASNFNNASCNNPNFNEIEQAPFYVDTDLRLSLSQRLRLNYQKQESLDSTPTVYFEDLYNFKKSNYKQYDIPFLHLSQVEFIDSEEEENIQEESQKQAEISNKSIKVSCKDDNEEMVNYRESQELNFVQKMSIYKNPIGSLKRGNFKDKIVATSNQKVPEKTSSEEEKNSYKKPIKPFHEEFTDMKDEFSLSWRNKLERMREAS